MAKGKKYDAAEKHFKDKEAAYQKEIKALREALVRADAEVKDLQKRLDESKNACEELSDTIEQLRKIDGMPDEDVKELVEGARSVNTLLRFFKQVGGKRFV